MMLQLVPVQGRETDAVQSDPIAQKLNELVQQ
jgi:hypothetical protein